MLITDCDKLVYQNIKLYILNIHNFYFQLYLHKAAGRAGALKRICLSCLEALLLPSIKGIDCFEGTPGTVNV